MKNTLNNLKSASKNKNAQAALLCGGMVIIGIFIGNAFTKRIPTLKNGDKVIATIDGKKFSTNDLYSELKDQGGQSTLLNLIDSYIASKETDDEDSKEADDYANGYIDNLKAQYESSGEDFKTALASSGFKDEKVFFDLVAQDYLRNLVAERFIKENNFSKSDIKKYYNENIEGSMVARYILIQPETTDEMSEEEVSKKEAEALKEANEVIEKLQKDGDFAELAKKHSDDTTTASEGGLYNGFTKDKVVEEFWNAATALKDGEYTTEPVESSYGYFVIYRVKQNKKPTLEASKDEILDKLFQTASQEDTTLLTKTWVKIRESYNLNIVDTDIKKSYNEANK